MVMLHQVWLYTILSCLLLHVVTHPCVHIAPPLEPWLAVVLCDTMSPATLLVVGFLCMLLSPWPSSLLRSPSSHPLPPLFLFFLSKSSIIVEGFCIVGYYRVIMGITHHDADVHRCCSEFHAPVIHPGAVARRAGADTWLFFVVVVISLGLGIGVATVTACL
jgi:hypothetical protein